MSWIAFDEIARLREPAYRRACTGVGNPILDVIAGIVGPIASGASQAYGTYAQQDIAKKDLKARQAEVALVLAQRQREAELQAEADKQAAIVGQGRGFLTQENVELGLGVLGIGLATWGAVKAISAAAQWRANRGR